MKRRTIGKVIETKVDEWINSIDDKVIQDALRNDVIVTGGCIASMLLGKKVNDYDVYLLTKGTVVAVAEYYCKCFQELNPGVAPDLRVFVKPDSKGRERVMAISGSGPVSESGRLQEAVMTADLESMEDRVYDALQEEEGEELKPRYRPIFITANAITLSDKVQVCMRFFGSPENIHSTYDFVHVTNYWTRESGLELNEEALASLLTRELIYRGSEYPLASLVRARKFIKRGWTINAGQILKIALNLQEYDLTDPFVLEEQLMGVDIYYFGLLLGALAEMREKKGDDWKPTEEYLVAIIDKIFG